jgi:agmatinase
MSDAPLSQKPERYEWQSEPDAFADTMAPRIHADVPSMMEVPIAYEPADLEGADAAFLGIPWEGIRILDSVNFATFGERPPDPKAVISRGGAYLAPDWCRRYSLHHSIRANGWRWPEYGSDFVLADLLRVIDYRNVDVKEHDVEETARRALTMVGDIVRAGAVPLVIGGDHCIPAMTVPAIANQGGAKLGIIWFDTHYDMMWSKGRLTPATQLYRIYETSGLDPKNLVHIGISGCQNPVEWELPAKGLGSTVFTIGDVDRLGLPEVVARAIEVATQNTDQVYVTLDVDVIDPVSFPAQKYPDPFGIPARDIRDALRTISRETDLAGFDICCIGPDYDLNGLSAMTANRYFIEVLVGLARRRGHPSGTD